MKKPTELVDLSRNLTLNSLSDLRDLTRNTAPSQKIATSISVRSSGFVKLQSNFNKLTKFKHLLLPTPIRLSNTSNESQQKIQNRAKEAWTICAFRILIISAANFAGWQKIIKYAQQYFHILFQPTAFINLTKYAQGKTGNRTVCKFLACKFFYCKCL